MKAVLEKSIIHYHKFETLHVHLLACWAHYINVSDEMAIVLD